MNFASSTPVPPPVPDEPDPLVLYRGGDSADGFAAALAAWRFFRGRGRYLAVEGTAAALDSVAGCSVYLLGLDLSAEMAQAIDRTARRVTALDHGLAPGLPVVLRRTQSLRDATRSVARMAWSFFHPADQAPSLVRFVEDRELRRWRFPETTPYTAALDAEPKDFAHWDALTRLDRRALSEFVRVGSALASRLQEIAARIAAKAHPIALDPAAADPEKGAPSLRVSAACSPSVFTDWVASALLAAGAEVALLWDIEDDRVRVSVVASPGHSAMALTQRFGAHGNDQRARFEVAVSALPSLLQGRWHHIDHIFEAHGPVSAEPTPLALAYPSERQALFHGLWSAAAGSPTYDKVAWRLVQHQLQVAGLID